jgi:hypothetical protein
LNSKIILLKEEETETNWDRLMELENAVELCIKLGLNLEVVHKRYKVVNNLKKESNLESKTHTITTIRHLIEGVRVNNQSFGEEEDMTGNMELFEKYTKAKIISPI